jgi:hypothetical protein
MLPGFRFLFATVILAAGVLVFGLGAAALLRAAHEEFATVAATSLPAPRLAPSPPAAQDALRPTLALLRIETPDLPLKPAPVSSAAPDAKPVIVARDDDAGADAPPPAPDAAPPADGTTAEGAVAGAADPAGSLEKELNADAQTPELQTGDTPTTDLHGSGPAAIDDNASGGSSSDAGPVAAPPTRMATSHAEEQATIAITQPVKPAVTVGKRASAHAMTRRRLQLVRARAAARSRALQQQRPSDPLTQFFGGGGNSTSDPRS